MVGEEGVVIEDWPTPPLTDMASCSELLYKVWCKGGARIPCVEFDLHKVVITLSYFTEF